MEKRLIEVHMRHGQRHGDSMSRLGIHEFLAMLHLLATQLFYEMYLKEILVYSSTMGRVLEMRGLLKSVLTHWKIEMSPATKWLNEARGLSTLPAHIPTCPSYGNGIIPFWKDTPAHDLPREIESWDEVIQRCITIINMIEGGREGQFQPTNEEQLCVFLYHGGVIEPMLNNRFGFQLTDLPSAAMILVYEEIGGSHSYKLLSPYSNKDWASLKEEGEHEID